MKTFLIVTLSGFIFLALYTTCMPTSSHDIVPLNPSDEEECCVNYEESRNPLLLVSTMDGSISALDPTNNGIVTWSFDSSAGPLLSSTLDQIQLHEGDRSYRLIPSLDGNLYMYDETFLQGIPLSADKLLSSSHRLGSDVVAGGKDLRTYGVDAASGEVIYDCGIDGCHYANGYSADVTDDRQILVIRRTSQTVRAVDGQSGFERWNVSVAQYEINHPDRGASRHCKEIRVCPNTNADEDQNRIDVEAEDWNSSRRVDRDIGYKLIPPEGIVIAYDMSDPSRILWQQKFDVPIAQLWSMEPTGHVRELSIFDPSLVPAVSSGYAAKEQRSRFSFGRSKDKRSTAPESLIYVGTYNSEKYVIPSQVEHDKMLLMSQQYPMVRQERARLYLIGTAESASSGYGVIGEDKGDDDSDSCKVSGCPTCSTDEVNALILRDQYPQDMGWYLYKHGSQLHDKLRQLEARSHWTAAGHSNNYPVNGTIWSMIVDQWFWPYWIEWLVMAVTVAVGVQIFIGYTIYKSQNRLCPQISTGSERSRTDSSGILMVSVKSQASLKETEHENVSTEDYTSRFATDFEVMRCLGRGGFGIVFEARSRMDDISYAVKRVAVANRQAAREKVMREVKALAKLDHVGIVRYHQSWFECPPPLWQEKTDKQLLAECEFKQTLEDALSAGETEAATKEICDRPDRMIVGNTGPSGKETHSPLLDAGNSISSIDLQPVSRNQEESWGNITVGLSADLPDNQRTLWANDAGESTVPSGSGAPGYDEMASEDPSEDDSGVSSPATSISRHMNLNCSKPSKRSVARKNNVTEDQEIIFEDNASTSFEVVFAEGGANESAIVELPEQGPRMTEESLQRSSSNSGHYTREQSNAQSANDVTPEIRRAHKKHHRPARGSGDGKKIAAARNAIGTTMEDKELQTPISRIYLYIQMQLCMDETLRQWLSEHGDSDSRDPTLMCDWFRQIVSAMEYVHDCGLMHRDLKPSNIFFSKDGQIKIGDFGLVTTTLLQYYNSSSLDSGYDGSGDSALSVTPGNASLSVARPVEVHTDKVGTHMYMSPEQITGKSYTHKVDIYSLGLIFFEMLVAFGTQMERISTLSDVKKLNFPKSFSDSKPKECAFISQLVSHDPEQRPECKVILSNDLLKPPSAAASTFCIELNTRSNLTTTDDSQAIDTDQLLPFRRYPSQRRRPGRSISVEDHVSA